jgi:branched-chain amino acid transport system permease protein
MAAWLRAARRSGGPAIYNVVRMLEQQLVNALSLGCVYALFALGFTLVFGVLGVINLSHGAVFMVGAYAALAVVMHLAAPLWVALIVALLASGLLGLAIDFLVLRPLRHRNAPHLIPMIATIGIAIFFNSGVQGVFGAENLRFPSELVPDKQLTVAGIQISQLEVAIIVLSFALMAALMIVMRRTQLGRALRAIAESPKAAALLGINVEGLFYLTSFTAAALGGVGGVLIALYSNAVFPLMGQPMLHKGVAVIILGGMGDIRGALVGGLFLGFAEVLSVAYIGSTMRDAVAFGLLFLVLLVRPQGIFGKILERKA